VLLLATGSCWRADNICDWMLRRKPTRIELKPEDKEEVWSVSDLISDRLCLSSFSRLVILLLQYDEVQREKAEQVRQEGGSLIGQPLVEVVTNMTPKACCTIWADTLFHS
jgi:hypothetical protein